MGHDYILQGMDISAANFSPVVASKTLDPLKDNGPDLLELELILISF